MVLHEDHKHIDKFALSLYMTEYARLKRDVVRRIEVALGACDLCYERFESLQARYLSDVEHFGLATVADIAPNSSLLEGSKLGAGRLGSGAGMRFDDTDQTTLVTSGDSNAMRPFPDQDDEPPPPYVDCGTDELLWRANEGSRIAAKRLVCLNLGRMLRRIQQRVIPTGDPCAEWGQHLAHAVDKATNTLQRFNIDSPSLLASHFSKIATGVANESRDELARCNAVVPSVYSPRISETGAFRRPLEMADTGVTKVCGKHSTLVPCILDCLVGKSQTARDIHWQLRLRKKLSVSYRQIIATLVDIQLRGWVMNWVVRSEPRAGAFVFRYFVLTPLGMDKAKELCATSCAGCGETANSSIEKRWAWLDEARERENAISWYSENCDPEPPV